MSLSNQSRMDLYVHDGKTSQQLAMPHELFIDMSSPGDGWLPGYVVCIHCGVMWIGIVSVLHEQSCPTVKCPHCSREAYPRAKWSASCEIVCRCGNRWKQFYLDKPQPTQARCVKCHAPTSDLRPWPTRE